MTEIIELYSIAHISAAARFSRLCHEVEAEYNSDPEKYSELMDKLQEFAMASVIFSVSYLEATINELFVKTVLEFQNSFPVNKVIISTMWNEFEIPQTASYSILKKYQIALTLSDKKLFGTDKNPYQHADLLITLRNALIHYTPEPKVQKIKKKLRAIEGLFPINPLRPQYDTEPFFPNKCLAHGCAKWAVETSIKFADSFFEKMKMTPNIDHIRFKLKTQ